MVTAESDNPKVRGVKKSWREAHELHKHSKHPRSKPGMARSFLAQYTSNGAALSSNTVQQAYNEYIRSRRKRRRRSVAAKAPTQLFQRRATDNADLKQLYRVKRFLDYHKMSIDTMSQILGVLKQLSE